jgi:hypothetical protein
MQLRSKSAEPETLRVHREMYERRLRDMESGSGSSRQEVDAANSPAVLEHQDSQGESENPTKKAASMRD